LEHTKTLKKAALHSETQIKSCDYQIMPQTFTPPPLAIMPFLDLLDHLAAPVDKIRACLANSDNILVSHPRK